MRHAKQGRKLGTDASHTKAMLRSLARALFLNERIKTTETRAKEVRTLVERIVTWGKRGDVHSRRLALAELGDRELVHKIFADIAPRYTEREGGYTRILKLGPRKGDSAPMVILELVD
ncbi:MAG: 50S ribosomal protein L17 [Actinobacteria bacterium]|nr:MAG: 50S ribosomal protein L17 [Actinomycetota bacterium]